ncbi:MAG: 30S ribosomal protein S9 [Candidatus Micrarchaeaceae archaeon]
MAEETANAETEKQEKKAKRANKAKKKESKIVRVSGKRKESVARATIKDGTGIIMVNGTRLEMLEPRERRHIMMEPIILSDLSRNLGRSVDIEVRVKGGGISAQAQAVRSAIAKGLVEFTGSGALKSEYLKYDRFIIVDDSRRVEPKKYLGPKARARFQTSYR